MVNHFIKFKGKKVFITGHTGFKGSWLSYLLDLSGAIVHGYSLAPKTTPSLFKNLSFSNNFTSTIGNINDRLKLSSKLKDFNPDYIFHLAAQPLVLESYKNPIETFETNFLGTLNLLEAIRLNELKTNVIVITTDKVYENSENKKAFVETDKLGGYDPYSASKASAEILSNSYLKSFFETTKVNLATVRAGNVIGGGDWSDDRLIPDIVKAVRDNTSLEIRNPMSTRPWQHVLEPLTGYLMLARSLEENPSVYNGSWNFGPHLNDVATVKEIVNQSNSLGMKSSIIFKKPKFYEAKYLQLDNSKAQNILGWKPKWKTMKSISLTLRWYKEYYNGIDAGSLIEQDFKLYLKNDE